MQYHNPFKIFGLKPGNFDDKDLDAVWNRLISSPRDSSNNLNIQGVKISIFDTEKLISELRDPLKRSLHEELFHHNELLNFLEYGHPGYLKHRNDYTENEALMNFIAPYFAFQYSEVLIQSLKAQDIETVKLLSQQELPQIETLENEYYYDTKIYLNDQLQEMDTLKNDSRLYIMSERELAMQVSDKVIELYNSLPDYFLHMRDDMAVSLRNTSQAMAAQGRREGAAVLLKQASKLKLNQALQKDVKSMQKQINPLLGNLPLFLMIGLGVVFLLFLIKWIESTFWPS
jgi:hypothetical protein